MVLREKERPGNGVAGRDYLWAGYWCCVVCNFYRGVAMDVVIVLTFALMLMACASALGLTLWEWYLEIRAKYAHKAQEESNGKH